MTYHYRIGTKNDIAQLKQVGLLAYGQLTSLLSPKHGQELITNLNKDSLYIKLLDQSNCFVCEKENKIVGMAFLVRSGHPTDIFQAEWCYLRMVGVHPSEAGQGIGRTLTQKCIRHAKETNETIIALHTSEIMPAARHLYESLGFERVKEISPRLGKRYWLYTLSLDRSTGL